MREKGERNEEGREDRRHTYKSRRRKEGRKEGGSGRTDIKGISQVVSVDGRLMDGSLDLVRSNASRE